LLLIALLLVAGISLSAQNPLVQHFTILDGLLSNGVYKIIQDSRKFIWLATDAGVAKYDGTRFTYFRIQDGLSTNDIVDITEDSFGRIWFIHSDASLDYYDGNTIHNSKNTPFLDSLKSNDCFYKMAEDKYRNIFFYNNLKREIYLLDPDNHVKKYRLPSMLWPSDIVKGTVEGMSVRYLNRNEKDEFLFWTSSGCFKTRQLSEKPVLVSDAFRFKDIIVSSNKSKYAIVRKKEILKFGIRRFKGDLDMDKVEPLADTGSENISAILEESNGLLWISTYDKGVFCFKDGKIFYHFEIKDAKSVIQDHENNVWICSEKEGIFKISPYFYQHQQLGKDAFGNAGILAMSRNDSMGIWCTNGKQAYLLRNNNRYSLDFQNAEKSFNQIIQVPGNILIIGETGQIPYLLKGIRLDNAGKKILFKKKYKNAFPIQKIIFNESRKEVSSYNQYGYVFKLQANDSLTHFKRTNIRGKIFNIYYNCQDELIINSKRNFIHSDGIAIAKKEISFLDNKIVSEHLNIDDRNEIFCMNDDSLFLLNNKRLYNLSAAFEQPIDLPIKHIAYDDSTLFIATSRNIVVCKNPFNILQNRPLSLNLANINFNSIHAILLREGKLYVASNDGLTSIPYNMLSETRVLPPIPYFQTVKVNDQMNLVKEKLITFISSQRINITFNSINYSGSPVIYSYQLEGTDANWTTVKGNDVVLQNLSKGVYNFKLRARKPASPWSEPIAFSIKVEATIWQNPFFYLFFALALTGLGFLIVLRQKNIELRRREMEHQIVLLEQKSLQAMMNPHFIFNSLGSIQNFLLHNKPYEAGIFLSKFARLIRQNFNALNMSMINMEEEVDRLKNYLDIEKLRLGDKFDYVIEIDENVESDDIMIPSMIIQPFVENAVWHGIAGLDEKGLIEIELKLIDEKSLQIIVSDSGIGIDNAGKFSLRSDKHLNLGMNITRKRLKLLGQKHGIETAIRYSEKSPGMPNPGTQAEIIVPFQYGRSEQPLQPDSV
jgi:ligand-binding sensor domain-containing protein